MIEIKWNPSRKDLRVFAGLWLLFFGLVTAWTYSKTGSLTAATTIGSIALLLDLLGLCFPRFLRALYRAWMLITYPIGWLVSHVAIAIVYYLVVTPIGLILRLVGRDALSRTWDPEANTYWEPHEDPQDPERYFQQF